MSNYPQISIIMPLYNKAPYVRRAINSIQQQTFADWELIVVDDGSTDGSINEIPDNDHRIRIFHQENKGPGAARNKGIKEVSGELVTFIDADDYYYPEKLEKEYYFFRQGRGVNWVLSAFDYEQNGKIGRRTIHDIKGNVISGQPFVVENAIRQLEIRNIHIDGVCVKKDLLEHLGGFREDMHCYEITELLIRCALFAPTVLVNSLPLFCVVDVSNSAFKISSNRIQGLRLHGESLYRLSKDYAEYSDYLTAKSRRLLYSYAALLIQEGRAAEARNFLIDCFPYNHDIKWWKMWFGSWLPAGFLRRRYSKDEI